MKDNFTSTINKEFIPYQLPNNWKWFLWSDLISNNQQGMIRSNSQLGKGNAEYLKMGDLDSNGRANFLSLARTEASQKEIEEFLLREGDFLINVRNSKELVGKTCIIENIDNRTVLFNHMLVRIDHGYIELNYFINSFLNIPSSKKMLDRIKQGTTTVIALYQRDLNKLPISLPDSKTFNHIVKFYKSVNTKIELNNKINTELEAMAKTLYNYWFVQFDFPDVNGKPYKTSGGKMVWNEELKREIPEGWEDGNIINLANLLGGGTPKTNNQNYWNGNIPFFTPADAEDSIYATTTKQNITDLGLKNSSTKLYSRGTIFITARGTVGKINIASSDMAMNQSCYALQGKKNVNPQFLFFYTNELVHYIKSKASGSIFKALVTNDFKFTRMIIPPMNLIEDYDVYSKSIFEKVLKNNVENQELYSLRDWLLPMLMNGQVTVGDVEEEFDMVAEPIEIYKKTKEEVVEKVKKTKTPAIKLNPVDVYKRTLLAAEIVFQLKDTYTLGHLKLQKMLYLCQEIGSMNLPMNFLKQAMGPYDNLLARSLDKQFVVKKWFEYQNGALLKYKPLENCGKHQEDFQKYFETEVEQINYLINKFKNFASNQIEAVATLYACWKEAIEQNELITDKLIITKFYNWSKEKEKFMEDDLIKSLVWMRKNGIEPRTKLNE